MSPVTLNSGLSFCKPRAPEVNDVSCVYFVSCSLAVGPYITWYQSPFVHFRAEYNYQDGDGTGPEENVVWLQCIFAAGPHKHERY